MFLKWLTIIGLSMTPALLLGQSVAAFAGIKWGFEPAVLIPVMAVSGFIEGVFVAWLGGATTRIGFMHRWVTWMRTPRAVAFANKWGRWGGMSLGVAALGQEPIILALRWLGVESPRLWIPIAVSNVVFAALWYELVKIGIVVVSAAF